MCIVSVNYLQKKIILSEFSVWVWAAKPVYWFEKWSGYGYGLTTTDTDTAKQHTRLGVREFAAPIVNLNPFRNELRILKEIRGKMVTVKLQSRRECIYTIHLIFPGNYLLGIKLLDIRSQPWCKQRSWSC